MKSLKVILILLILMAGLSASMWSLGLFGSSEAQEGLLKIEGLVLILGATFALLFLVLSLSGSKPDSSNHENKQGPQF